MEVIRLFHCINLPISHTHLVTVRLYCHDIRPFDGIRHTIVACLECPSTLSCSTPSRSDSCNLPEAPALFTDTKPKLVGFVDGEPKFGRIRLDRKASMDVLHRAICKLDKSIIDVLCVSCR